MRETVKRLIGRGSRTAPGKHLLHAATRPEVVAERFSDVPEWPAAIQGFEDLAFLFTSSQLNHGVASLRLDEAAFLFRLVRRLERARMAEIGRFKGGSTFVTAAAMTPGSTLVSYDLHVPSVPGLTGPQLDRELREALDRFGIGGSVELVVADSRVVDLPEGPLDLLFVDGDHSYDGCSADIQRWSPLVASGGHLVLHDAIDTGGYGNVYPGVARACDELGAGGDFEQVPGAGTMAHFVRRAG